MAFLKYANASISSASLGVDDWNVFVKKAAPKGVRIASVDSSLISEYSPNKYLLSHATIVASVDVEEESPKNDRGWPYYITPETEQFTNSNGDSWERNLLLATYPTFKGAQNYFEHIQVPELSKGRIIDAVARDIGPSIYIDILVATDKKHEDLVRDIESGVITTLSMGCLVQHTTCTNCGNVASDETELCGHIKYQKGNHFFDKRGKKRIIVELCGHRSDPKSVTFIEASWVANPAFKGAVLRNILLPSDVKERAIEAAFGTHREVDHTAMLKAASRQPEVAKAFQVVGSFLRSGQFDFGDAGLGGDGEEAAPPAGAPAPQPKGTLDELSDDVKQYLKDKVRRELREELQKTQDQADAGTEDTNENLVRASHTFGAFKRRYAAYGSDLALYRLYEGLVSLKTGGWRSLRQKGYTGREVLALSHFMDEARGQATLNKQAYEAIVQAGGTARYPSAMEYLAACGKHLGVQKVSSEQAKELIRKGKLYSCGSDQ